MAPRAAPGHRIADARVQRTVELDEVIRALDPGTRRAFQTWQQSLARAVGGRGRDLNDALGNLPAFADDGTDLLRVLDVQHAAVRRLVNGTSQVFGSLNRDQAQLRNLITSSASVFAATSRSRQALARALEIFPTFLAESRLTFRRLEAFSADADPLVQELRPALRDAVPTLRDARPLAPDLQRFFRNLPPLIDASKTGLPALRDTLDGTRPLLGSLQPFLEQLNPVLQWLEYSQRTVADFISNGAGALADTVPTSTPDEVGHYLRQFGPKGAETVAMYPDHPATNRGNAYLLTNALSGERRSREMIFPEFDCDNTGRGAFTTTYPDTNAPPSCRVQQPPAFPPGNTSPFPHIGPADYSK